MAEQPIKTMFYTALWRQLGAATDMLENALLACPASLWRERLWSASPPAGFPPQFAEFWYVTFHTLVFFDLHVSGVPEEEFAPPAPFAQGELDSVEALPERPYTREELHAYLVATRQKCHTRLLQLSDEQESQAVSYPWSGGQLISYLELQLYTLRHVQEHAAQLSLFLGQHGVPGEALDWVPQAGEERGS
ncbi:DinB family protein [Dictyobacter kobayashii]|nr:DinB family protein [Dictyobacter kobayashii]